MHTSVNSFCHILNTDNFGCVRLHSVSMTEVSHGELLSFKRNCSTNRKFGKKVEKDLII